MSSRGLTFASLPALGLPVLSGLGPLAADLGYDSAWVAETTGTEAFSALAQIAAVAPTLGLGTGVLALQLRSPALAAMGAATLSAAGAPAVHLGVGISSPVVVGRWHGASYGDRPVARVREYLQLVSACLDGEQVAHDGKFWSVKGFKLGIRLESEQRPKLVVGALNELMLRTAGELADGVLLNYLPATAVPWCVAQVRAGEAAAGRAPGSCRVHAYVHVGVCDPDGARESARRDLFSYAVVPAYARAFARAGFTDEVDACLAAHAVRDRAGALAAISDRMIDAIDICGDAALVREAVAAYEAAGVDHAVIMPLPWGDDRTQTTTDTLEACRPG